MDFEGVFLCVGQNRYLNMYLNMYEQCEDDIIHQTAMKYPSTSHSRWWFGCHFYFPINIGLLSSSQLTNSYFSRGVGIQPPTSIGHQLIC